MKCIICDCITNSVFMIDKKNVCICNDCANEIMLQQSKELINIYRIYMDLKTEISLGY